MTRAAQLLRDAIAKLREAEPLVREESRQALIEARLAAGCVLEVEKNVQPKSDR